MPWRVQNYNVIVTIISFFKGFYATCLHSFLFNLVVNVCELTPCILTPSYFLTEHAKKHYHKQTTTPPPTVIASTDNHYLPKFASLELVTFIRSLREAVGALPLLLGGACPLLRAGARTQCLCRSTVRVGSKCDPNWGVDGGGGSEAQDIGLSYGWGLI